MLSLKQLSAKLTLLLSLISFHQVADVWEFYHNAISFSPHGMTLHISRRTKTDLPSV